MLFQLCHLVKKLHCDARETVVQSTPGHRCKKLPPVTREVLLNTVKYGYFEHFIKQEFAYIILLCSMPFADLMNVLSLTPEMLTIY